VRLWRSFKRWFGSRRYPYPELDPRYRERECLKPVERLPVDVVEMLFRYEADEVKTRDERTALPYFWKHLDRAQADLSGLLEHSDKKVGSDSNVAHIAYRVLELLGERALQDDASRNQRRQVAAILGAMTRHDDFLARKAALQGLGPLIADESLAPGILSDVAERLADDVQYVCRRAQEILVAGGTSTLPKILESLEHEEGALGAMQALQAVATRDPSAIREDTLRALARSIEESSGEICFVAVLTLESILASGPPGTEAFRETLPGILRAAMPRCLEFVVGSYECHRVPRFTPDQLARFWQLDPGILPAVAVGLRHQEERVRAGIAETLGIVAVEAHSPGGQEAVEILAQMVQIESNDQVRFEAAKAYRSICGELPDQLIPIATRLDQTEFFLAGFPELPVRFTSDRPLSGLLKESDLDPKSFGLQLPEPQRDLLRELAGRWVDVTGVYSRYAIAVEKIAAHGALT
jgi:hypothetical protein